MKRNRVLLFLSLFFKIATTMAAIDNRYLPLFDYAYQHQTKRRSVLASNLFVITSHQAYVDLKGSIPLPEIFGKYDMVKAANAIVVTGRPNPLPTSWQTQKTLIWDMTGRLQSQGFWFGSEKYLKKDLSIGFKVPFMHVSNQLQFIQTPELQQSLALGPDGTAYLYQVLNQVNRELGFNSYQWQTTDFGDFDLYLRWGTVQDYVYKCKHIDLSLKIGALLPMTGKLNLNSPVAITLGFYHHYGLYFETDFNCDLKDDLKVGFWLNATNRFSKTQLRRMPAGKELPQFGALVHEAQVDPGLSIGFSPYVWFDDLHNGLGVRASYRLCWHGKDYWRDVSENSANPGQLANVIKDSHWLAEWFTVGAVYDLEQTVSYEWHAPFFYLDLDIPTGIFDSELVSKSYRLTGGFEFHF